MSRALASPNVITLIPASTLVAMALHRRGARAELRPRASRRLLSTFLTVALIAAVWFAASASHTLSFWLGHAKAANPSNNSSIAPPAPLAAAAFIGRWVAQAQGQLGLVRERLELRADGQFISELTVAGDDSGSLRRVESGLWRYEAGVLLRQYDFTPLLGMSRLPGRPHEVSEPFELTTSTSAHVWPLRVADFDGQRWLGLDRRASMTLAYAREATNGDIQTP